MAWVFATMAVPQMVADTLLSITTSPWLLLTLVMLVMIVFASLLDGLPALIIFYPILATTVAKFGIDPLHFGLLSVAALGIGLILPPIGLLLVVVCQIGNVSLSAVSLRARGHADLAEAAALGRTRVELAAPTQFKGLMVNSSIRHGQGRMRNPRAMSRQYPEIASRVCSEAASWRQSAQ
jgi:hypothetical protein